MNLTQIDRELCVVLVIIASGKDAKGGVVESYFARSVSVGNNVQQSAMTRRISLHEAIAIYEFVESNDFARPSAQPCALFIPYPRGCHVGKGGAKNPGIHACVKKSVNHPLS